MPSTRPCAAFEPISPDFDIKSLVESTPNFEWVVRIHCDMIDHQGMENFEKLVLIHVIIGGKPLVIEGYHERLDRWTFALQWLWDNCGSKIENARDLTKKVNIPLTISHYLNHMALLTNQWTDKNYKDPERQRMYLKDIDCPSLWHDKLRDLIPPSLFYLNESTGDEGGLGAVDEAGPNGPGSRRGRGVAKSGDLMSSLPKEMRAENMMCYVGHEGTYTPAHREMCASLGQNIMVECSQGGHEDGKPTKPGSSLWFMTESKERHVVGEYWLSRLGHDIEVENHFAQINAWKGAPFNTWVVEQRVGDFILIPPLAPHQVWNRGTRTMKVAWNRTTVETLEMALNEALPRARMVCRDEQYKNKAIIYFTLQKYSKLLKQTEKDRQKKHGSKYRPIDDTKVRQVEKDFRRLQALFTQVLVSESFSPNKPEKNVELIQYESYVTCSYCRCNIFNRFLTCPSCIGNAGTADEDTYDICMECYAMGRSCACISKLKWVEQFPWGELVQKHEQYRHQILQTQAKVTEKSPKSLRTELDRLGKKRTLAQICQAELQRRPFHDITKPAAAVEGVEREEEIEVDENGYMKKKRKIRRSEKFAREHSRCHVDSYWEPKWKQAKCSNCDKSYCYGVLFRAYDIMPQDVLADANWKCPSCQNICNCRVCSKRSGYKPYTPSGTILGHNTKAVADPRSVESLVDFSSSNISWIKKAGDDTEANTRRLNKRVRAAGADKAQSPDLGDNYAEGANKAEDVEGAVLRLARQEGIPIDPALGASTPSAGFDSQEDDYDENPEVLHKNMDFLDEVLPAPQYVVPPGGIIRDNENAYDSTEAITYCYPDPEAILAPVQPPEVLEGPETYESLVPDSPAQIEMVNRKRKREKVDEGDKSYGYKKRLPVPEKPKLRKSLIVKLAVNTEKLVEMNKMTINAQRALGNITEDKAPAPVLGSDLRALNAEWVPTNGQAQPKKTRLELLPIDKDDDFTPSRYRDRRKGVPDSMLRPNPDSDITRRTTRMQNVTYEIPSDEEEFAESLPERPSRSKLATIQRATEEGSDLEESEAENADSPMAISSGTETIESAPSTFSNHNTASSTMPTPLPNVQDAFSADIGKAIDAVLSQPAPEPQPSSSLLRGTTQKPAKAIVKKPGVTPASDSTALAEAQLNRKAKLAAMDWMDGVNDYFDETWSEDERDPLPPKQQPPVDPQVAEARQSLPNMGQPTPSPVSEPPRPVSVQKASAADWGDDSSDDDLPTSKRPGATGHGSNGWTPVNGINTVGLKLAAAKLAAAKSGRRPL